MTVVALLLYDIPAFKFSNIFPIYLDENKKAMAAKTHAFFFLPWDC